MIEVENTKNSDVEAAPAVNNANSITSLFMKEWEPYCGRCPKCGSTHIEFQTGIMLTSNPPQLNLRCVDCGNRFFSGHIETYTPILRDPLPGEVPYIGDPLPGTPDPWNPVEPAPIKQYGWICPKCGRVLAPHMDTCKFCGGNSVTTLNESSNTINLSDIQQELNKLDPFHYTSTLGVSVLDLTTSKSDLSTTQTTGTANTTECFHINMKMADKFLNESESVFEAVDKYKEWEKKNKDESLQYKS